LTPKLQHLGLFLKVSWIPNLFLNYIKWKGNSYVKTSLTDQLNINFFKRVISYWFNVAYWSKIVLFQQGVSLSRVDVGMPKPLERSFAFRVEKAGTLPWFA